MKFIVIDHIPFESNGGTPGIKFSGTIEKDGVQQRVFVDAWTSDAAANMTKKALKLLGLDAETCGEAKWVECFSEPYNMLAGREIEVDEQENEFPVGSGKVTFQYRFRLNVAAAPKIVSQMFAAMNAAKKPAAPGVPARPTPAALKAPLPGPRPIQAPQTQQQTVPVASKQNII